jgi:hypothetical protein
MIRKIKISLLALMTVISVALILPIQTGAMTGVCVDAPGIPCNGGSSGGSGGGSSGYYVDPNYRAMQAERRRQEAEERARKAEAKRKYNTPYRGFEKLQGETRRDIKKTLNRLDKSEVRDRVSPKVSMENGSGTILVPDAGLGDIILSHPVNPTASETGIASEQLLKAAAVLELMNVPGRSSEEWHFISSQAAAVMTGARSYMHVIISTRNKNGSKKEQDRKRADKASGMLKDIQKAQNIIAASEAKRDELLEQAKKEIKELAAMGQKIKSASSTDERKLLREKMKQREARLDELENEYFALDAREKEKQKEISSTSSIIKDIIIWKK